MVHLANAPVSYGIFSLARPDLVALPTGAEILRLVADASYDGVDLGPHGLFGTGSALVDNLVAHNLGLAGGWLDFPFSGSDAAFEQALAQAKPVLDDFALVAESSTRPAPLPTLADSGDARRKASPGGGPDLELPPEAWKIFVERLDRVLREVRDRGLEPTFHHHASTYIETPREIERLLEDTTVDLTFDSGHLILGGGDVLEGFRAWRDRINHLHIKDVSRKVLEAAAGAEDLVREVWEKRVFVPLGEGDLDVPGLVGAIVESDFDGWIVVEQDVVLLSQGDVDRAVADQVANREALRRWFP